MTCSWFYENIVLGLSQYKLNQHSDLSRRPDSLSALIVPLTPSVVLEFCLRQRSSGDLMTNLEQHYVVIEHFLSQCYPAGVYGRIFKSQRPILAFLKF